MNKNHKLGNEALYAIKADGFCTEKGYCQKWVREVISAVYGDEFKRFEKASAKLAAYAWRDGDWKGYKVILNPKPEQTQEGDVLYKTIGSGGAGHVGIRVVYGKNGGVAENSSFHWNGEDARGVRDIYEFFKGTGVQVLVRITK